jgi:hypothetical protein
MIGGFDGSHVWLRAFVEFDARAKACHMPSLVLD